MEELHIGIKGYEETTVNAGNTASSVGCGLLDVFSTPDMIALIEIAAMKSVLPYLGEGQGTVGMRLDVSHLAPTPMGRKVWAETELVAIEGRVLTFNVAAYSDVEKIGEGTHKRCIISSDRFLAKMYARYNTTE